MINCAVVYFFLQHRTSGDKIYHRVTQIFMGLCNLSTRLQISRVTIWNTGSRGPAWSFISRKIRSPLSRKTLIKSTLIGVIHLWKAPIRKVLLLPPPLYRQGSWQGVDPPPRVWRCPQNSHFKWRLPLLYWAVTSSSGTCVQAIIDNKYILKN